MNIENTNKETAIIVNNKVSDILINNNNIDIDTNSMGSIMAIVSYGGTDNVTIRDNKVVIKSNAGGYVYAIDASVYLPDWSKATQSPTNHNVINNTVIITGQVSAADGIYYDELVNGVISNNTVIISGTNGDLYGIVVSYSFVNTQPENITIDNNTIELSGVNMVYGVELYDGKSVNITNNNIKSLSDGGAYSIAAKGNDLVIDSNSLSTYSKSTEGISSWDSFGVGNQSVYIMGNKNVNVTNNVLKTDNNNWLKNTTVEGLYLKNNTFGLILVRF